jgi:maleylacetate reductase
LDPALTLHTPEWLWLSTGIRAVDHAVEDLCSINTQPISEATAFQALRLLGRGLRAVKQDPADLSARLDCQLGAWMSIIGSSAGVHKGASHGIGHVLGGTAGVPHGYTSCVMLPHVLRYNHSVNAQQQQRVSEALGEPDKPACDVLADLVAQLGLPRTLREVGVKPEMLDVIARNAMHDRLIHTNPRKIHGPEDVRQILDAAW